jgi:hypothetical protein
MLQDAHELESVGRQQGVQLHEAVLRWVERG